MKLSLIEKNGQPSKTRIKISVSEWNHNAFIRKKLSGIPVEKESRLYKYFLVDLDLLNKKN